MFCLCTNPANLLYPSSGALLWLCILPPSHKQNNWHFRVERLICVVFPFCIVFFYISDVESGGLISKVLLANADALCAAVSPLMDIEDDPLYVFLYERIMLGVCVVLMFFRCTCVGVWSMRSASWTVISELESMPRLLWTSTWSARSTPRSAARGPVITCGTAFWVAKNGCRYIFTIYLPYISEFICYLQLLLQKTYKNLEQRVLLECDGVRIPLPSLQGIVVLNIPR